MRDEENLAPGSRNHGRGSGYTISISADQPRTGPRGEARRHGECGVQRLVFAYSSPPFSCMYYWVTIVWLELGRAVRMGDVTTK